jgi:hypothetical protein
MSDSGAWLLLGALTCIFLLIFSAPPQTNIEKETQIMTPSIHRGGSAGYMPMPQPSGEWNTPIAQSFSISSFDTMILGSYQWQNVTAPLYTAFNTAGMHTYGYTRFAQVEYSPTPEYCSPDWVTCNANEDWFIHDDVTGGRIWNPSDDGFLMDIGNAGFRTHWINFITSQLATYTGIKNIFIDNTLGLINPGWIPWVRFDDGGAVTFKAADAANWYTNAVAFLAQIKAAFPTYNILINVDSMSYPEFIAEVDGVMIEGFAHPSWLDHDTYASAANITDLIDYFQTVSATKIVWYMSGSSDGSTSEVNEIVKFCLAGALIANDNANSVFSFNSWFSFDDSYGYYPIMDTDLGTPVAPYYVSQNVLMREYTGGLVLFNPSANNYNIVLAGYKFLSDGSDADAFTLNAHTATILVPDAETLVYPAVASLSLSAATVEVGEAVSCTATFSGDVGTPTGTVLYYNSSNDGLTWTLFGLERTLVAGAASSTLYRPPVAGTYLFKADYSGDTNYEASSNSISFTVNNPVVAVDRASGALFDNLVAYVENQPSETMFKPGLFQPGLFTECRLLSAIITKIDNSPNSFFKSIFFQPGLFSECKLLTENIKEFEK